MLTAEERILSAELNRVLRRSWQYAGLAAQVEAPGEYLTVDAGPVPVVVVRDRDGVLRAHVNVCRHQGHIVMTGAGRCAALRCPNHAWTYDLDGTLRAPPRPGDPGWDPDGLDLLPAAVDTWGPLVFVHADPRAKAVRAQLGDPPEVLARARLRFERRVERELPCNWKVAVENSFGHGRWLWPNASLNGGGHHVSIEVWLPDGPDRTIARTDHLIAGDTAEQFFVKRDAPHVAEFRRMLEAALRA